MTVRPRDDRSSSRGCRPPRRRASALEIPNREIVSRYNPPPGSGNWPARVWALLTVVVAAAIFWINFGNDPGPTTTWVLLGTALALGLLCVVYGACLALAARDLMRQVPGAVLVTPCQPGPGLNAWIAERPSASGRVASVPSMALLVVTGEEIQVRRVLRSEDVVWACRLDDVRDARVARIAWAQGAGVGVVLQLGVGDALEGPEMALDVRSLPFLRPRPQALVELLRKRRSAPDSRTI
jgi:hypothetical protein